MKRDILNDIKLFLYIEDVMLQISSFIQLDVGLQWQVY